MTDPRTYLAEIPTLAAELPRFLTATTTAGDEQTRRPVPGSRPPLNLEVLDLIEGRELALWSAQVIGHQPEARTVTGYCQFLSVHSGRLEAHHKDWPASIEQIWKRYRAATRQPVRRWPCPQCKWEDGCDPQGDPDSNGEYAIHMCRGCGRVWRLTELQERLDAHDQQVIAEASGFVPLRYAAEQVKRNPGTLKNWIRAGRLEPVMFDKHRKINLFSLDRVRELARETPTRVREPSCVA